MNLDECCRNARCALLGLVALDRDGRPGGPFVAALEQRYREWLDQGCHAGMAWMERHAGLKANPGAVMPGTRAVLVFAMPWPASKAERSSDTTGPSGSIASYAMGRDYHAALRQQIKPVLKWLENRFPTDRHRLLVDANPLAERLFALLTGKGFLGRNTMFIHHRLGPRVFLATLLTTVSPDLLDSQSAGEGATEPGATGCPESCRLCIASCPTGALREVGESGSQVDARRCLSYHSIESDSGIPEKYRRALDDKIFGCSACVDVCPLGGDCPSLERFPLEKALAISSHEDFCGSFAGKAVMRAGWRQFLLNACVAAGNSRDGRLVPILNDLQGHPDPLIREHAAWALARHSP